MNWIFHDSGVKPKHLEECFAIESRERQIVSCYWNDDRQWFDACAEFFYLGPLEDYDNYVLAWIPTSEVINDYMEAKAKQNVK